MKQPIKRKLEENLEILKRTLGVGETFDISIRTFEIGEKKAGFVFVSGFVSDDIVIPLLHLLETERGDVTVDVIKKIVDKRLAYHDVTLVDNLDELVGQVLAGPLALLIDGQEKALILDVRSYLYRSPEEPDLEKSTRGPADGFVEVMLFNVSLVRRRIRDVNFRAEIMQLGKRSKNDLALVYIKDIINDELLESVREKLRGVDIDGLPLADKTVEELITGGRLNPLPVVRYTERPDLVAAHILEGNLAVIVDNSPTALILPAPFFTHFQSLEDYRKGTVVGTYFSLLRLVSLIISVLLPAIWLLLATNKGSLPEYLQFIGVKQESTIGLGIQFILITFGIDLVRMASIQTPSTLATSLSLIGALLLGDFAVKVGLFSPEVILYMAIAAICNFAIPGYEMALVLKFYRVLMLLAVIIGNFWGLLIMLVVIFLWTALTRSFGIYYLWPLLPFDYQAMKSLIIRQNVLDLSNLRPAALKPKDRDRSVKEDKREREKIAEKKAEKKEEEKDKKKTDEEDRKDR